jgi:hypothetical protein
VVVLGQAVVHLTDVQWADVQKAYAPPVSNQEASFWRF